MTSALEEALQYGRLAARDRETFDLLRAMHQASDAAIGFHAQQAVEKALKAVLFADGVEFRRTHDLEELANLLVDAGETLPCEIDALRWLNPFAVEFRYQEGDLAGIARDDMVPIVASVLAWCRARLGDLTS